MKNIKIIISSVFIVISFFVGYLFGQEKISDEVNKLKDKKSFVNLEIKKKKINIFSSDKNTIILVNGKETSSGSVILE